MAPCGYFCGPDYHVTQTRSPRNGEAPVSTSSSPRTLSTASVKARMKIPTGTSFASNHRFGGRASGRRRQKLLTDAISPNVPGGTPRVTAPSLMPMEIANVFTVECELGMEHDGVNAKGEPILLTRHAEPAEHWDGES
jgi:hypothetical protein